MKLFLARTICIQRYTTLLWTQICWTLRESQTEKERERSVCGISSHICTHRRTQAHTQTHEHTDRWSFRNDTGVQRVRCVRACWSLLTLSYRDKVIKSPADRHTVKQNKKTGPLNERCFFLCVCVFSQAVLLSCQQPEWSEAVRTISFWQLHRSGFKTHPHTVRREAGRKERSGTS